VLLDAGKAAAMAGWWSSKTWGLADATDGFPQMNPSVK